MTNLLLRIFVPNWKNPAVPAVRSAVGKLSGITGIVCNLLLCAGKLFAGILSGSVAILADAVNNLSDAASAIVTLIGFKLAQTPADKDHPYGHARYEYLAGLTVAALILVIGFETAKTSVEKIFVPETVTLTIPVGIVLIASVGVKLWLSLFNRKLGKLIDSKAVTATAADSRNDVISTAAVLVAAVVQHLTQWQIDGIMGLAVALFILYSGVTLARETVSPLLGEAASPELRQLIVEVVTKEPRVLGYHDLMVHDYGPGQRFASLHVEMDQHEDPLLCHELIDDMERECLQKHSVHLVIHYDPVVTGDEEMDAMRTQVKAILQEMDERLSIHDFRMVRGAGHTNLIFDVARPQDLEPQKKAIKQALDSQLNACNDTMIYTVITFDPEAFNGQ